MNGGALIHLIAVGAMLATLCNTGLAQTAPPVAFVQASNVACKVGRANVRPGDTVTWQGQCADGLAQGPGIAQWFEGGKQTLRFEGSFATGFLEGKGKMIGADGDRYEGDYKGGLRHGYGVYVAANGTKYEGEYRNNQRAGKDDAASHVGQALPTPDNRRHILKLGESASGITFARKGNDAIAFLGDVLVTKCVTASTFQGERRIYLDGAIGNTRLYVSPTSSKGQFVAVACAQEDDPAYDMHLINLITRSISSPKPSTLFAALHPWISFSPDERYAVLNQHGDEGNYAPLVLDLRTGQGKILAAPIIPEDKDRLWVDDKTIRYRVGSICDGPIVDDGCKSSLGEYEFDVDVSTLKVKKRRVGNWKLGQ